MSEASNGKKRPGNKENKKGYDIIRKEAYSCRALISYSLARFSAVCNHDIVCDRLPYGAGFAEKSNFLMPPGNHAILALLVAAAARTDYVSPPEIQQWNPSEHWIRHGEETIIRIQKRPTRAAMGTGSGFAVICMLFSPLATLSARWFGLA